MSSSSALSPAASPSPGLSEGGTISNVSVSVRVRPLLSTEDGQEHAFQAVPPNSIVPNGGAAQVFETVFGQQSQNTDVYTAVAKRLVLGAFEGINATVFVYGQTSSGKTHTMTGYRGEPGIVPLAVDDVFASVENSTDRKFLIRVSYYEIYNEVVRDLLEGLDGAPASASAPASGKATPTRTPRRPSSGASPAPHRSPAAASPGLRVRQVERGRFAAEGLVERVVRSREDVESLLRAGSRRRAVGVSNLHDQSSRSHSIFRLSIESQSTDPDDNRARVSEVNLVDLAGSETLRDDGSSSQQSETKNINLSLTQLTRVIRLLSQAGAAKAAGSAAVTHIPYRDSTLTKLLANSLGGNARTALVCTITPAAEHQSQSKRTLALAASAKKIRNRPRVNETSDSSAAIVKYRTHIDDLTKKLESYKALEDQKSKIQRDYENLQRELASLREKEVERDELEVKLAAASEDLVMSHNLRDQLQDARSDAEDRRREASQLTNKLRELEEANERLQAEMERDRADKEAVLANAERTKGKLGELEAWNSKLLRDVEKERENLDSARKGLEDRERELGAAAAQTDRLVDLLAEERLQKERVEGLMKEKDSELQRLSADQEALRSKLAGEVEARASLESAVKDRDDKLAMLISDQDALQSQLAGEVEARASLESAVKNKEAELAKLAADQDALQSQLAGEVEARASLESAVKDKEAELAKLAADQDALQSQLAGEVEARASLESAVRDKEAELAKLAADQDALQSQLAGEVEARASLESAVKDKEAELAGLHEKTAALSSRLESELEARTKAEEDTRALSSKLESERALKEEMERKSVQREAELEQLRVNKDELVHTVESERQKREELGAAVAQKTEQLGALESETRRLTEEVARERQERDRALEESLSRDAHLRSALAERDAAIYRMRTSSAAKDHDRDHSMAETMQRDLGDLSRLESMVSQLESEKLAMQIEHEEAVAGIREKYDGQLSKVVSEKERVEDELNRLTTSLRRESNDRMSREEIERLAREGVVETPEHRRGRGSIFDDDDEADGGVAGANDGNAAGSAAAASPAPGSSPAVASAMGGSDPGGVLPPEVRDTISRAVREAAVLRGQLADTEAEMIHLREEIARVKDESNGNTLKLEEYYKEDAKRVRDEYEAQLTVLRSVLGELDPRYAEQK